MKLNLLFFLICLSTFSQENVNSSYGNASNSSVTINYSIGQLFTSEFKNSTTTVSQGIQQNLTETITLDFEDIMLQKGISFYPNPFSNQLFINIVEVDLYDSYEIFNTYGVSAHKGILDKELTIIPTQNFSSGVYYLSVKSIKNSTRTIKIIKQ